ncbi:MAG: hypothetical protein COU51_03660 [Parcubacteria group bacterium CG10_big_fil_rev_8_21_14_0_10_36_14]|nr:MAG: hypothetical protein COU51_03660 [Parcubacteria group bacterium CG10_big_fil_rev_8_21_14_0_10_36_14]
MTSHKSYAKLLEEFIYNYTTKREERKMAKQIVCPLCKKHKINDNDLLYYIYFPYRKKFAVHTLKLDSCPQAKEMVRKLKPIIQKLCAIWLSVSIYKLEDDCYRFYFRIIVKDEKALAVIEERVGPKFSLDKAIEAVDMLKVCLLAVFAEKIQKENPSALATKAERKDLAEQVNKEVINAVGDLYKILQLER